MSLGSSYGQIQDDSAYAVQVLTQYGVVVVCSAGNAGDKPYIVGSPSIAPGAISVAQTTVPSAKAYVLEYTANGITKTIQNTASVDWAPINQEVAAEIVYVGRGCPGDTLLKNPAGKIALVDRGTCAISLKVDYVADAGAIGMILANNTAGDPPSFSYGGGDTMIPTIIITQGDGAAIKAAAAAGTVTGKFGPSLFTPLASSIVSSSSRGPSTSFQTIKPEVGAPGGSLSAEVGTGDGQTAFSGTSGAAPMVAGAAAIVLQAHSKALPTEVKARLMNTANSTIYQNPATSPGLLTPITRIGAGEVRADKAVKVTTLAYDAESGQPALSFGYEAVQSVGPLKFKRMLRVENRSTKAQKYTLTPGLRFADDAASGAVSLKLSQSSVTVAPGNKATVNLFLDVDPSKLSAWNLNSGSQGGNGPRLTALEFDGYVTVQSATETVAVPWHLLPHKAADNQIYEAGIDLVDHSGSFLIGNNKGATIGATELFALTGTSRKDYPSTLPWGINLATPDLAAVGVRTIPISATASGIQFAIATHDQRAHANYPLEVDVYVDTNNDGADDYVIYNSENGGFGASGQNLVNVVNLTTGTSSAYFYTDADLNSSALVLTAPLSALGGITPATPITFSVYLFDNYFTGNLSDGFGFMKFTGSKPRFAVSATTVSVDPGLAVPVTITHDPANDEVSAGQLGILGIHRDAAPGRWWDAVSVHAE
jgi:hypothetical protein